MFDTVTQSVYFEYRYKGFLPGIIKTSFDAQLGYPHYTGSCFDPEPKMRVIEPDDIEIENKLSIFEPGSTCSVHRGHKKKRTRLLETSFPFGFKLLLFITFCNQSATINIVCNKRIIYQFIVCGKR